LILLDFSYAVLHGKGLKVCLEINGRLCPKQLAYAMPSCDCGAGCDSMPMHRLILIVLLMMVDGVLYSAHAQCAATDKIYIDPRLVPQRPPCDPAAAARLMTNPTVPPAVKDRIHRQCMERNEPIRIPFGEGHVLIHPTNPCIQQKIP
jgi:hypothetical protein